MNVNGIRTDLAAIVATADGWQNALEYVPEDAKAFPACIVNPPRSFNWKTLGFVELEIPVTLAVGAANFKNAQALLDAALSTGSGTSVLDKLRSTGSTNWAGAAQVTGVENMRQVKEGNATALAIDVIVEVTAAT